MQHSQPRARLPGQAARQAGNPRRGIILDGRLKLVEQTIHGLRIVGELGDLRGVKLEERLAISLVQQAHGLGNSSGAKKFAAPVANHAFVKNDVRVQDLARLGIRTRGPMANPTEVVIQRNVL